MVLEYDFLLEAITPILFHADDVMQADELAAWRKDPKNKSMSVPGDDRSPPWTWQTYLHHDGEHIALPPQCLMKCLSNAGAKIIHKGKTTFKSLSQSSLLIMSEYCRFTNQGGQIAMTDILNMRDWTFKEQFDAVKELGFSLSVKRARIGQSKNVRVRAQFDAWEIDGTIAVSDPAITEEILRTMFEIAGKYAGLLDWRPASKQSPGSYGMFTAEVTPAHAGARGKARAGRKAG